MAKLFVTYSFPSTASSSPLRLMVESYSLLRRMQEVSQGTFHMVTSVTLPIVLPNHKRKVFGNMERRITSKPPPSRRFHWLWTPLNTGEILSRPTSTDLQDGSISAVLFMCALVCFGIVAHMCRFISTPEDRVFSLLVLQCIRGVLMASCIGFMLYFVKRKSQWETSGCLIWPKVAPTNDKVFAKGVSHEGEMYLSTKGIIVFGAGRIILDMCYIVRTGKCLDVLIEPAEDIVNFSYHIIYVIYIAIQIPFLLLFLRATFKKCTYFRYVILYMFAINICLWFTSYIYSIRDLLRPLAGDTGNYTNLEPNLNIDVGPISHRLKCAHDTTSMHALIRTLEDYFYPFSLEYSLLSASMLYHIWTSMKDFSFQGLPKETITCKNVSIQRTGFWDKIVTLVKRRDADDVYREQLTSDDHLNDEQLTDNDVHPDYTDNSQNEFSPIMPNMMQIEDDEISDVDEDVSHSGESLETRNRQETARDTSEIKEYISFCGIPFMLGLVLSILLSVFAYLLFDPHQEERDISLLEFYIFRSIYHTLLIICCYIGFGALKRHSCTQRPFREDTTLLVISVNGSFLYIFFGLTASIGTIRHPDTVHYPTEMPCILLIDCFINFIQVYLQVTFLTSAMRYDPGNGQSVVLIRRVLSYIFICNFGMWILDSFFETQAVSLSPVQKYYFGEEVWHVITKIAYPFGIFFRFHSFVVAYSIFVNFMNGRRDFHVTRTPVDIV
ncbi:uncharacterized protein LOC144364587 [Saccoglossus kowalevskii]